MDIIPEEFYKALDGVADEETRLRVLRAIEEKDPVVVEIMRAREEKLLHLVRLLRDEEIDLEA